MSELSLKTISGDLDDVVSTTPGKEERAESKPADFETAISATGYGKFNIVLFALCAFAEWTSVFETTTMSYVFPAAECDLGLSLSDKGMLNAATYIGMMSSSLVWGYLCDTFGRRKLLYLGFLFDALFVVIGGLAQSFIQLAIAKFLGGVIINGPFAALQCYISEFHGTRHRSRVLMILGTISSIGNVILPLLALGVLPLDVNYISDYFKFHSWNLYILLCASPAITSTLGFIFLPESPRFLMTCNRNEEALQVFRRLYRMNTGKPEDTYPIKELVLEPVDNLDKKNGNSENHTKTRSSQLMKSVNQIKQLFLPPYLSKIMLIFSIQFLIMMSLNTLRLWLPQLLQAINDYEYYYNDTASFCTMLEVLQDKNETVIENESCIVNFDNIQVYTNSIIVAVTSIVGYIAAGTLITKLGKKTLLNGLCVISGLTVMSMYFSASTPLTVAQSSVFITFGSIGVSVIIAVSVDTLPTSFRTVAVSLSMSFGRLGATIGNLVFPLLLETGCAPAFFSIGSVMIGCALLTFFLPNTELKALK